jgi:hypothetical protein
VRATALSAFPREFSARARSTSTCCDTRRSPRRRARAASLGDVAGLTELLAADAVLTTDGGSAGAPRGTHSKSSQAAAWGGGRAGLRRRHLAEPRARRGGARAQRTAGPRLLSCWRAFRCLAAGGSGWEDPTGVLPCRREPVGSRRPLRARGCRRKRRRAGPWSFTHTGVKGSARASSPADAQGVQPASASTRVACCSPNPSLPP